MAMALLLSIFKIGQVSAASELMGFVARISLVSWIVVAKSAFEKDFKSAVQNLAIGSQIALVIAILVLEYL